MFTKDSLRTYGLIKTFLMGILHYLPIKMITSYLILEYLNNKIWRELKEN
jgi:hypothetical protein